MNSDVQIIVWLYNKEGIVLKTIPFFVSNV